MRIITDFQGAFQAVLKAFSPTTEGLLIVCVIWIVSVLAVISLDQLRRGVTKEKSTIDNFHKNPRIHSGRITDEKEFDKLMSGVDKRSLIRLYADSMWAQRSSANPDLAAILEMVSQKHSGKLTVVRSIPNILMLIGLMGTVIGMAHVIGTLGPIIQSAAHIESPQDLANALAPQMLKLQTAFACTLHGILASVIITFLVANSERSQTDLLADIDRFGLELLAPRIFPESEEAQLDKLNDVISESRELFKDLHNSMKDAATNMSTHVKSLGDVTKETSETLTSMSQNVTVSSDLLSESVGQLKGFQQEVKDTYVALMDRHAQSEQSFKDKTSELVSKIDGLMKDFNRESGAIITQLQTATKNYAESTDSFKRGSDNFERMSFSIGQAARDAVNETMTIFSKAITDHSDNMKLVEGQIRNMINRFDPALIPRDEWQRVVSALETVIESGKRVQGIYGNHTTIDQTESKLSDTISKLESTITQVSRNLQENLARSATSGTLATIEATTKVSAAPAQLVSQHSNSESHALSEKRLEETVSLLKTIRSDIATLKTIAVETQDSKVSFERIKNSATSGKNFLVHKKDDFLNWLRSRFNR